MAVTITVNTMDLELTPQLKEYVEKKIQRLSKFLDSIDEAKVDLKQIASLRSSSDRQIAQCTIYGRNLVLRAEVRSDDMYASIDTAIDKLQRQIEKYKGKRTHGPGEEPLPGMDKEPALPKTQAATTEDPIVRRKTFPLEPMSEREAIDQMQFTGHEEFFIFQNLTSGGINILYRRRDGSYGILEPQMK